MRDIEIGEEILLDYGEAYNREFLYPKKKPEDESTISTTDLFDALPRGDDSVAWVEFVGQAVYRLCLTGI